MEYIINNRLSKPKEPSLWYVPLVCNPITCLNKDNGLKNFEDKTVPTNRADLLWHGIGHVVYAGKQRAKVIIYNNYARTILKSPQRKYDEEHNYFK